MTEQTGTRRGTISISLALIPAAALAAFIIISPSCNSPLSQLKGVTFNRHSPPTIEEPGVFIAVNTKYYDIIGSTEKELNEQITSLGPNGYTAYTASSFTWSFDFKQHDGVCSISHVRVDTLITFTYPRWKDMGSDRKLVQVWYRDLAVLENHERGHEEIARKTSRDLYEYLHMLLPPYHSCDDLNNTANALARAILEESRNRDAEYDRVTDHGRRVLTAEIR